MFNIYIPFVDELDIIFHFLDIYYWYVGAYCFHVSTKNMGLCRMRGSSLPICSCETLESGEHVTVFPAGHELGPFVTARTSDPLLSFPVLKETCFFLLCEK